MQGGYRRFVSALNARPAAELEAWLQRITGELDAYNTANPMAGSSFAVNQIVHGSNDRLQHDLEMCGSTRYPS